MDASAPVWSVILLAIVAAVPTTLASIAAVIAAVRAAGAVQAHAAVCGVQFSGLVTAVASIAARLDRLELRFPPAAAPAAGYTPVPKEQS